MKSVEPLIYGEPPSSTSNFTVGRRLFANGTSDRHGLPRLLPEDSDKINSADNKTMRPEPRHGGDTPPESDAENFDLGAVSGDDSESESESGGESLLRNPKFRKKLVKIHMSPVMPKPKAQPSYLELTDSDEETQLTPEHDTSTLAQRRAPIAPKIVQQVVGSADGDGMSLRGTSKSKGKARAVSKRKAAPEIMPSVQEQKVHVRGTMFYVS